LKDRLIPVRILCHRVRRDLTCGPLYILDSGRGATGDPSEGSFRAASHKERRDFDDGANALWSLYGKEAKTHDEARFERLAADMDGIPTFVRVYYCVHHGLELIHAYLDRLACLLQF